MPKVEVASGISATSCPLIVIWFSNARIPDLPSSFFSEIACKIAFWAVSKAEIRVEASLASPFIAKTPFSKVACAKLKPDDISLLVAIFAQSFVSSAFMIGFSFLMLVPIHKPTVATPIIDARPTTPIAIALRFLLFTSLIILPFFIVFAFTRCLALLGIFRISNLNFIIYQ